MYKGINKHVIMCQLCKLLRSGQYSVLGTVCGRVCVSEGGAEGSPTAAFPVNLQDATPTCNILFPQVGRVCCRLKEEVVASGRGLVQVDSGGSRMKQEAASCRKG